MIVIDNLEKLTSKKDKSISNSKKLTLSKKITATVGSTVTLRDIYEIIQQNWQNCQCIKLS